MEVKCRVHKTEKYDLYVKHFHGVIKDLKLCTCWIITVLRLNHTDSGRYHD